MLGGATPTVPVDMSMHLERRWLAAPALCVSLLFLSGVAAAQPERGETESVVLLAPAEVRAEWTAALQVELAARGAMAIPADPPEGATPLLGDAEAQRIAIERGASAAVWAQAIPGGWRLRMIAPDAESARVIPLARDADARTVALIIVSLLDGRAERAVDEAPPPPSVIEESVATTDEGASSSAPTPLSPAVALSDPSTVAQEPEESPRVRGEPYVHWSGRIGVSGLGIMQPSRAELGLTLRAGIAMRYDWFEGAVMHDIGPYFEQPNIQGAVQPLARMCLEGGGATERTWWAFHAGVHGCFGSIVATEVVQPGFISSSWRTHASGGAYAAVSFALVSWIRLFVRADLDLGWTDFAFFDSLDFLPAISTFLSFE